MGRKKVNTKARVLQRLSKKISSGKILKNSTENLNTRTTTFTNPTIFTVKTYDIKEASIRYTSPQAADNFCKARGYRHAVNFERDWAPSEPRWYIFFQASSDTWNDDCNCCLKSSSRICGLDNPNSLGLDCGWSLNYTGSPPNGFEMFTMIECEGRVRCPSIQPAYRGGCLHPEAANYDENAHYSDGSCIFLGCTDASASNYQYWATKDDGSCMYSIYRYYQSHMAYWKTARSCGNPTDYICSHIDNNISSGQEPTSFEVLEEVKECCAYKFGGNPEEYNPTYMEQCNTLPEPTAWWNFYDCGTPPYLP
jgi:hypothetical protein